MLTKEELHDHVIDLQLEDDELEWIVIQGIRKVRARQGQRQQLALGLMLSRRLQALEAAVYSVGHQLMGSALKAPLDKIAESLEDRY